MNRYYWTVVTVFVSACGIAEGFNIVNETFKYVTRAKKQQSSDDAYHFGNTFIWDKDSHANGTR